MKEFYSKKSTYIFGVIVIIIFFLYFYLYPNNQANTLVKILETLDLNIVTSVIVVGFGLFLYHLESKRGFNERLLLQRLELRKRSLECFEEINTLIIKIRFYNTSVGYDISDIRISFDKIANFFYELQNIYKNLSRVVPNKNDIEKLDNYYQGWQKYFTFSGESDLKQYEESVKNAEHYLVCLKKALMEFTKTLQFKETNYD
ncbi:MAG: hypothetical protein COV96_00770 [Candidatus Zambryskibacteria bacterium CG11_big_fil_rev_8_21_14_0_20_42_18]|uniref:Uncharacterized protein n=1 Tax=Candidatus Zambryskibacteria bacterium CG_4_9_14_3_um_filter_42_15 TaxID=1975112 RepID=A0A2M7WR80_9BACT|nr:MAG: hypothetical protein COV96_00770 [Candidatus Zambryskibacteria bacterium CG11_big_fil_rev_8_21_14_0_20_42_18]PJA32515.1 MAG: hypothetical protein CO185_02675 [Candidatus Zambryskibacteria bacterium CG_4_9_14_3_um_filter_42_15]